MTAPKLRFPTSDELEVSSWQEISLSNLAQEIFGGGTPPKQHTEYWSGNLPWISSSDLFLNDIHSIKLSKFITKEAVKNSATKKVPKGSVLVVSRVGVGKVALAKEDLYTSQDFTNIITPSCDSTFLAYSLSKMMAKKVTSVQGSAIKGIPSEEIKEYHIRVPRKEEQQKIAAFFTALDRRIENCEKRLVTLEQLKKGLLQKMLSSNSRTLPEIRFKGFEGSWKAYKLSEVLDEIYVGQTPRRNHKEFWNGAINWLSSRDLTRGFVEETAEKITNVGMKSTRLRIVPNGTVVIAMIGLDAENTRGNCGILKIDSTVNQSCAALIPKKDKIIPEFLFHWYRFFGNDLALHYTQGTKQQNYNVDILSILPIHIPSLEEQKKISAILSTIDEQIVNGEKTKNNLIRLKNGLLQQMFI